MSLRLFQSARIRDLVVRARSKAESMADDAEVDGRCVLPDERDPVVLMYEALRAVADHENRVLGSFSQLSDVRDPHDELQAMLAMANEAAGRGTDVVTYAYDVGADEADAGGARFYFVGDEDAVTRVLEEALAEYL